MNANHAPLSEERDSNRAAAPETSNRTQREQQSQPRLYAPLFSLLNPIEDSAAAADVRGRGDALRERSDRASAEAPLLGSRAPSRSPHLPASQEEGAHRNASASCASRCWAALRCLCHNIRVGCAREVPPAAKPRRFSPLDRSKMTRYESVDTYEAESMLYKDHLETRSHEPRWFMWVFVVVLGVATSALSVGMMTLLHVLNSVRYELFGFGLRGFTFADAQRYPNVSKASPAHVTGSGGHGTACTTSSLDVWAMLRGYSVGLYGIASPRWYWSGYLLWVAFAVCTSAIASGVCYLVPQSVGSGIPEVRAFLNGVSYPMMRSTRVLVAKTVAVVFTVASGVCTDHYGHLMLAGAMLGSQLLQRRHGIRCYHVHFVDCFRNPRDRRTVLVIGAAAGIAAAFCVSVGGLLVILELLSAVFPVRFALYVFAACLLSTLSTQVYWSYCMNFDSPYRLHGGLLLREVVVLFRSHLPFGQHAVMNLIAFIPAFVIGLCSGACAVGFVRLSWVALYCRRLLEVRLRTKAIRYVLPILFTLVYVSVHYWVAVAFSAEPVPGEKMPSAVGEDSNTQRSGSADSLASSSSSGGADVGPPAVCRPVPYTVRSGRNMTTIGFYGMNGFLCPAGSYRVVDAVDVYDAAGHSNGVSSVTKTLLRRQQTVRVVDAYTSLAFSYADSTLQTLLSQRTEYLLPWHALLTFTVIYFFASAVYSGLALCGDTILPSLVIGAAIGRCIGAAVHSVAVAHSTDAATWADPGVFALFGAGSFVSATSGLSFGIGAILIECTADFRHLLPLMFAIAVARRVLLRWARDVHTVYLEARAVPLLNAESYLERYSLLDARHVMHSPVVTLPVVCTLDDVARALHSTTHHGFPVVSINDRTFKGVVTRAQLKLLLWYIIMTDGRTNHCTYDVMQRVEDHVFHSGWEGVDPTQLLRRERLPTDQISLYPYVDTSAFTVLDTAALPRTYEMFTTLGLRHLVVVDRSNCPVGMITRKDLVSDNLSAVLESQDAPAPAGGRTPSAVLAAALACLRKPFHPTPAQVTEVARQSSTRNLDGPSPLHRHHYGQDREPEPSTHTPPPLHSREANFAQVVRRVSLLRVPSPFPPSTRNQL
ncbi:putative chloride channel protein [Leishmania infantum JPCM5]|uniref:Chloride channel protein n=2 Tax=Leishmania infantum TaxID=5671 RepID=A4I8X1_LEIIN|nr:putative chloride channel protein [Leishmania infantum JPCM5]CAM71271.2 putative chloride channel protein [Leishmania infantum JPCM5]|eukprot:XP_001468190.2 putative chloride channel protein [Leishmania infantum JPCM5]